MRIREIHTTKKKEKKERERERGRAEMCVVFKYERLMYMIMYDFLT